MPVPNLVKKSRGRKVPVDKEATEDIHEPVNTDDGDPKLVLDSSALYSLPEIMISAYSLCLAEDDVGMKLCLKR